MKQIQKNPQESDRNVIGGKKDNIFKAIIYLRASSFDLWFTFQEHIPVLKLQAVGPRTRAHPLHSPQFHMTTGKPQNPSVPRKQSQTQRTAAVFTGIEKALPQKAGPRKPSASAPRSTIVFQLLLIPAHIPLSRDAHMAKMIPPGPGIACI